MKRLAFGDDMMRALADGAKTMTRRMEKRAVPPCDYFVDDGPGGWSIKQHPVLRSGAYLMGSRLVVGDLVAATCASMRVRDAETDRIEIWYRFQKHGEHAGLQYNPARIMPAALAPFVLWIKSVRAERLGKITDVDAIDEGMMHWITRTHLFPDASPREVFEAYWAKLYGSGAWERDRESWVWVYKFEIAERRIP
jgi:hypothetical protein